MCWPSMEHHVQELTGVAPDLLGLAGYMLADDGDEPGAEGVVEDHSEADYATSSHHLGAVLYQIYQWWKKKLKEAVHLSENSI